jgi:quinol monooxygenase YgiN
MTMAIELARFTVEPDEEEALLAERPAMISALRRRFPACLAAFLTREDDGSWLDVLVWRSRAEAEEAAALVEAVPECAAWFRHIAASGGLSHVEVRDSWASEYLVSDGGAPGRGR